MYCDWCYARIMPETQIVAMTLMGIPVIFCKKCYWDRQKAQARREIEKMEDETKDEILV